jgi:hypothetical protein
VLIADWSGRRGRALISSGLGDSYKQADDPMTRFTEEMQHRLM